MKKGNISVFSAHKKARASLKGTHMAAALFSLEVVSFFAFLGVSAFFEGIFASLVKNTPMKTGIGYLFALLSSLLFLFFLIAPLWRGMHALSLEHLLHGKIKYSVLFCFFSSKRRYFYAVRASFAAFLRLFVLLSSLFFTLCVGRRLANDLFQLGDKVRATMILSLTCVFCILLLLVYFFISLQRYLMDAVAISAPLLRYSQIKAVSKCAMRGRTDVVLRHRLCFLPYTLLSLILLGIPLVFVLPYRLVARDALALKLLEK